MGDGEAATSGEVNSGRRVRRVEKDMGDMMTGTIYTKLQERQVDEGVFNR